VNRAPVSLYNTAAMLMDELTSVEVVHDGDTVYTYLCQKSVAGTLHRGDKVVCNNRYGLSVATVILVHSETNIDPDMKRYRYRFVVCKVDVEVVEAFEAYIERVATALSRRKNTARRDQALAALGVESVKQLLLEAEAKEE
jgi:hypothetical protein